jgi:hypothetical protein
MNMEILTTNLKEKAYVEYLVVDGDKIKTGLRGQRV